MASTTITKEFYFEVPKSLRQPDVKIKIHGISIKGDDFVIEFVDRKEKIQRIKSYITGDKRSDIESVRKLVECNLANFFDEPSAAYCTGKLVDVIDRLYDTDAAHVIDKVVKRQRAEAAKDDEESGLTKEKPIYPVRKFCGVTTVSPNGFGLAEAVIINGKPLFAYTINGGTSVTFYEELETEDMILRPPTKQEYPPDSALEYASEDEFMESIRIANEDDHLYKLYNDVRKFYTREYFVDTEAKNSTLLALYTITSYFQDKFSTVHYIWLVGDNGSGKNSIVITYSWLGYRVFYAVGANEANIREYLGNVQEGQGTIAEDEIDNFDEDSDRRRLYTAGYASGSCVPKIMDGNTKSREQRYYLPYCQKMCASENLPSMKYAKGMLDRTFPIKCVKGFPLKNVKWTKRHTKDAETERLISELLKVRKRLLAFRLVHFDDVINDIANLSISGRALELTESALQLFHKYKSSPEDEEIFNQEILPTLSEFLKDRLGRRNVSLEGKLYPIITKMVEEQGETLENDKIFATVQSEMEGRDVSGKQDTFYVDELGMTVTRTKIMKVLREKFKALQIKLLLADGSRKNGHTIFKEVLERIKASYEDQWEIKIGIPIEDSSARLNQVNQVIDQIGGVEGEVNEEEDELNNTPNNPENELKEALEGGENTSRIDTEPGLVGLPVQSYSIEESNNKRLKCPHCNFRNIYQESIEHHVKYKHSNKKELSSRSAG